MRRPRLRIEVTSRTGAGSGAHKKLADTATGCKTGPAASPAHVVRAALAHSASIAPPWTLGPMVQRLSSSPSYTPGSTSRRVIAVVNNAVMFSWVSAHEVRAGELQRLGQHGFALVGRTRT